MLLHSVSRTQKLKIFKLVLNIIRNKIKSSKCIGKKTQHSIQKADSNISEIRSHRSQQLHIACKTELNYLTRQSVH